jgi:hypothetical protein
MERVSFWSAPLLGRALDERLSGVCIFSQAPLALHLLLSVEREGAIVTFSGGI